MAARAPDLKRSTRYCLFDGGNFTTLAIASCSSFREHWWNWTGVNMRSAVIRRGGALFLPLLLAACGRDASNPAPPRVSAPIEIPVESSAIAVPISAQLIDLQKAAERAVPATLATID
jgi:hypothetical protein